MIKTALFVAILALGLQAEQTIVRREANQQSRIHEGVKSGTLTKAEAARLNAQQAALRRQVRHDDGGGLSTAERARIAREQNQQSRRIAKQKSDAQVRPQ